MVHVQQRTILYTCGSNDTVGENNLELEFKDELCVSCALCQVYSEG